MHTTIVTTTTIIAVINTTIMHQKITGVSLIQLQSLLSCPYSKLDPLHYYTIQVENRAMHY